MSPTAEYLTAPDSPIPPVPVRTTFDADYPDAMRAMRAALGGTAHRRAAVLRHLRFFEAFARCGSFSAAVRSLALPGLDERHGHVRYHVRRLGELLGLDSGLTRAADHPKRPRLLNTAGEAVRDWVRANPELLTE